MWLVVVDTTQIQPYIFGSNRLRESIGASYLVDMATGDWALQAVRDAAPGQNYPGDGLALRGDVRIEEGLEAEVLYAGGGNFVVLFDHIDRVQKFQASLSQQVLEKAPGLQIVVVQLELDWHTQILCERLDQAWRDLAVQKRKRAWPAPLLGLSVTAACRSTGLPASGIVEGIQGEPGYLASDEIRAKVDVASLADQRLRQIIRLQDEYRYPADFEDLGGTAGEYSYIAVVHADGDEMGRRIADLGKNYREVDKNRAYVQALGKLSCGVQQAASKALQAMLDCLVASITRGKDGEYSLVHWPDPENRRSRLQIRLAKQRDGRLLVPFRPIVFGGDDITFVCDGRLGLALATLYLQEFERQTPAHLTQDGAGLTACAGIAIVKSHYPFVRAYALATDLTGSAKRYRRNQGIPGSCLDWHFALSGLGGSIQKIREREYMMKEGSLAQRPVTLEANPKNAVCAWPVVLQGIRAFQQEQWAQRRNKVKALREALREGASAVEHFRIAFNDNGSLPEVLSGWTGLAKTGWQGKTCGYFDAIELADWFLPLKGGGR
ncbi:MAG TPA: hypothetical protein VGF67_06275 [Ktedonobacteraceae bacterium]|jgi:hypothetical protein